LSPQFNILRLLERRIFDEVFAIVFQWYQKKYRDADVALAAKRQQLDGFLFLKYVRNNQGIEQCFRCDSATIECRAAISPLRVAPRNQTL